MATIPDAPKAANAAPAQAKAKAPQLKPDQMEYYRQEELLRVDYDQLPARGWMDEPAEIRPGNFIHPAKPQKLEYIGFPNAREWAPLDPDWKLPEDWKEIVLRGIKERLDKYRSFKIFMDCCVRCGACADKCHFYIGSGDPKNMPVLRAELLRSVYRNDFTTAGKLLGRLVGARPLTVDVIKEWFLYFYQCTECRRCSVFCPYGIDTAEITMMGRELMHLIGVNINWILEPAANCFRVGNHLGITPHAFKGSIEGLVDDVETATGIRVNPTFNRKGAEVLFVTPSADAFAAPAIFTLMGYMLLFHQIGLDYTFSALAFLSQIFDPPAAPRHAALQIHPGSFRSVLQEIRKTVPPPLTMPAGRS